MTLSVEGRRILRDMEMAQARPKRGKTVQALLLEPPQVLALLSAFE